MEQSNYYSIIPADVRYDERLKANEKLLYGEIVCLCNKSGYCYATNEYFSNLYNVSTRSITEWIKKLEKCNHIVCVVDTKRFKDGTVKKERKIYLNHIEKSQHHHIEDFCENHIEENFSYNNTSNINNINKENIKRKFEKFWEAYPKKKSKGNAEKWFDKNNPSDELVDIMIDKISLLKNTEQWTKDNGQYIPYPTTWLNAKGWEDEIYEETGTVLHTDGEGAFWL